MIKWYHYTEVFPKVLYFFFKDTKEQKWLNTAMCAVLHQLLLDDNPLVSKLQNKITQAGVKLAENTSTLWELFSEACQYLPGSIICVFDALDECDPENCHDLIRKVQGMLREGRDFRVVKFLVTTRGYPRLLKQFRGYESGLIHLDGDGKHEKDAIQQEISLVLDHKFAHLSMTKKLDQQPDRKAAIQTALRSKGSEQRTYLWLKLVFIIMEQIPWKSDRDWEKVILSPPQSVNDAYATLLKNVPEEEKEYVKVLLHLMVAANRPLTLREMSIATMVRESPGAQDEKSLGLQSDEEFKDWIIQTCGFFVTVYDNELYFIHQTAKEFLVGSGPGTSWPQVLDWFSPVTDEAAHKIMAESSIAYLSLRCFNSARFQERTRKYHSANTDSTDRGWAQDEKNLRKDYGFLEYTTRFWVQHFKMCQSFNGANFRDVGDEFVTHYIHLFTTGDCRAPGWMLLHLKYISNAARYFLANSYNVCDAALWLDHGRLLVYSLHHNACNRKFLLHAAVELKATDCVEYIAAAGIGINARDESGATALCFATDHGSTNVVNILLDYNADIHLGPAPHELPLSYVILQAREDRTLWYASEGEAILRRIVCHGADLNNTRVKFQGTALMTPLACISITPVHTSVRDENIQRLDDWMHGKLSGSGLGSAVDLVQRLDLFAADAFMAAYNQSLVKFLLEHGADIDGVFSSDLPGDRQRSGPRTPLELACFYSLRGDSDHVFWNAVFLLYSGANSRIGVETGRSAMDWLLRARMKMKTEKGRSSSSHPLDSWVRWNVLAGLLLKYDPPLSYINKPILSKTMQTRLHLWAYPYFGTYDLEAIKLLLDNGAEVNCQDLYGKTPVHLVVSYDFEESEACSAIELLKMLIAKGAELNLRDSLGRTPMHYLRPPSLLNTMVENGADIEARDHSRNTPLQTALNNRCHRAAAVLLRRVAANGAEVPLQRSFNTEQRDRDSGATLLAFVSVYHAHDALRTLVRRGADTNALPNVGGADVERYLDRVDYLQIENRWICKAERLDCRAWRTVGSERRLRYGSADYGDERPLHLAMHKRWTHAAEVTVEVLLKHGADIEARSSLGQTPLQVACYRGNEGGARFLLKMGANVENTAWDGDTALDFACAAWQPNAGLIRTLLTHAMTSDSGYYVEPDLGRIAGRWLNETRDPRYRNVDDTITRCCRTAESDVVNHDETGLANLVICRCKECCPEHERRVCVAVQLLLDAGAWIQLRYYKRDMEFPFEIARERGWTDLANLLEQAAVPSWRRAWIPPKTRRRSLPAVVLSESQP